MSLCKYNIYEINHNVNFTLLKNSKTKVFQIYKTIRHSEQAIRKQKKIYPINSNNYECNNYNIKKEINLYFICSKHIRNGLYGKENNSICYKNLSCRKIKSIFGNKMENKYQNKKRSMTFIKKNVLIKPIMIEEDIISNDKNNNINEKKTNELYSNKYCLNNSIYYNYFNFYNNNYNNYTNKNININYYQKINNNKLTNYNIKTNNKNCFFNSITNVFQNNLKNKNITDNLEINSNTQSKLKFPILSPDEYYFPVFRIPFDINKNFINNQNYNNNSSINYDYNKNKIFNPIKNNNSQIQFKKEKNTNLPSEEKNNSSLGSSTVHETLMNNNEDNNEGSKNNLNKGRKQKKIITNIESKHTKYSEDNMMRKIKNKVIESCRLLINKILKNEFKYVTEQNFPYQEFRKIQGSFGQELNIKYNFWFYLITIKEMFCLEISNKYAVSQKSSNKELIDFLYSDINKDKFIKTKKLLETPFHQYYHDIFLNEDEEWKYIYSIEEKDNKYQIEYLLNILEEEEKLENVNNGKNYINDMDFLAHNYEKFFLEKKPRNLDYKNKKNEFIKNFLSNTVNDYYLKLAEKVKELKEYYDNRNLQKKSKKNKIKNVTAINSLTEKNDINLNDTKKENIIVNEKNDLINNKNEKLKRFEKNKKNKNKKIFYIVFLPKNKELEKNINIPKINLKEEEEKKIYKIIEKKGTNKIRKIFNKELNNNIDNELYKDINDNFNNKSFCEKKRNREKRKYFISCKIKKRIDNDIKDKFFVNKYE